MSELEDSKRETFAQQIAIGMQIDHAYDVSGFDQETDSPAAEIATGKEFLKRVGEIVVRASFDDDGGGGGGGGGDDMPEITRDWLSMQLHQLLAKAQHREDLDAEITILAELAKLAQNDELDCSPNPQEIHVKLTRLNPTFSDG